jgi:hypothetical protein
MSGRYLISYRCRACGHTFAKHIGAESAKLAEALRELTDGKSATALAQGDEPPITVRIMDWHPCLIDVQGLGDLISFQPVV